LFAASDDRLLRHSLGLARQFKVLADSTGEIRSDMSSQIIALQNQLERKAASNRREMFAHDDWLQQTLRAFV
jgi:hypothetical protein